MDFCVFFTLGIISSWLIFFSTLFYITLTNNKAYGFVIFNKKQLIKYWLFMASIILISFYIFFLRVGNMGRLINIYWLLAYMLEIIEGLSWSAWITSGVILILWLIFMFLALKLLYKTIKQRLLAMYMYYYQYEIFRDWFVHPQIKFRSDFYDYLLVRVYIFTYNPRVLKIANIIWPRSFYWFEPRICKIIIPYSIIFDIMTQEGNLFHVFNILPWFYLYMLGRTGWSVFGGFCTKENREFSNVIYRKFWVNGKIIRCAILANPDDRE